MNLADATAIVLNGRHASEAWLGGVRVWQASGGPAPALNVRGALASFHNFGDNAWAVPLTDGASVGDVAVVAVATDSTTAGFAFLSGGADYLGAWNTTAGDHVVRVAVARVVLDDDDIAAGVVAGTYSTFGRCIGLAAVCEGGGAAVDFGATVSNVLGSGALTLTAPSVDGTAGGASIVFGIVNAGGNAPGIAFARGDVLVDTSGVIPGGTAYMHGAVASLALVDSSVTGDVTIDVTLSAPYWQRRGIGVQVVIAPSGP